MQKLDELFAELLMEWEDFIEHNEFYGWDPTELAFKAVEDFEKLREEVKRVLNGSK